MAIFFNARPESGELACHSFYRRPAASVLSAGFGAYAKKARRAPDTAG
jgi:hypothetical protein